MKKLKLPLCIAVIIAILIRPQASVDGARRAMLLWSSTVAPSLFPFFALMPVLTGPEACMAYNRLFSGLMGRLFHLPGSAAPAVVIGMLAGSPGGAIAVRRIASTEKIPAKRLSLALTGVSPAYLVLGVGCGIFGSAVTGWKLAFIQAGIQLALLILLQAFELEEKHEIESVQLRSGILAAVESMMAICGYMVIFGAVANVLSSLVGESAGTALLLICDLPGGLARLGNGNMLLSCAAIGFAGLCIGAQNLDIMKECGIKPGEYFAVRAIAGALFACIAGVLLREENHIRQILPFSRGPYAFSMFFSCAAAIPGMIFLSKNLFLNKRKLENDAE